MSGDKDWGDFRKLYTKTSRDFKRLPFAVRAASSELMRYAERKGRIIDGEELDDDLVADLAREVQAHPGEEKYIREALEALLEDGYLVFEDGWLTIRNFKEAQETDSAKRMRNKRKRDEGDAQETGNECDAQPSQPEQPKSDAPPSPGLVWSDLILRGGAGGDPSGKVPCPARLLLTRAQAETLQSRDIPPDFARRSLDGFLLSATGDPGDCRTVAVWRKCAAKAVNGDWNDPEKRKALMAPSDAPPEPSEADRARVAAETAAAAERKRQADWKRRRKVSAKGEA